MKKYFIVITILLLHSCAFTEFGVVEEGQLVLSYSGSQLRGEVNATIVSANTGPETLVLTMESDDNGLPFAFLLLVSSDEPLEVGQTYFVSERDSDVAAGLEQLLSTVLSTGGNLTITDLDRGSRTISFDFELDMEPENGGNAVLLKGKGNSIPYQI